MGLFSLGAGTELARARSTGADSPGRTRPRLSDSDTFSLTNVNNVACEASHAVCEGGCIYQSAEECSARSVDVAFNRRPGRGYIEDRPHGVEALEQARRLFWRDGYQHYPRVGRPHPGLGGDRLAGRWAPDRGACGNRARRNAYAAGWWGQVWASAWLTSWSSLSESLSTPEKL